MKKLTKCLALLLALVCLCATASAEGLRLVGPGFTAETTVVDPVTGDSTLGYDYLIEAYEKAFPGKTLDIEAAPWDNWTTKLQTTALGELADVLVHGGTMVDYVESMVPYLDKDPSVLDTLYVQGTYRRADESNYTQLSTTAVPVGLNVYMLCFDKQIFDDFQVEYPNSNDTWETLLEKLQAITGTNPVTGKECWGATINMSATNLWRPFVAYNWAHDIHVTEFADNKWDSKIMYNTEEVIGTFTYLQKLAATFKPGWQEKVGFEGFGSTENDVGIYLDVMPLQLYKWTVANDCVDRYGYCAYPKNADGVVCCFMGDWNMAIPTTAADKDGAWEFIKWLATDVDAAEYILATNNLPNSVAAIDGMVKNGYPFAEALAESLSTYPANFWLNSSVYYDNLFGSVESIFSTYVTPLYAQEITPEACAAGIQVELEQLANSMR